MEFAGETIRYVTVGYEAIGLTGTPIRVESKMPTEEFYKDEVLRLSRKGLRGVGYSAPEYNELLDKPIKWKGKGWKIEPVKYFLRELHDANKGPGESLIQIQAICVPPDAVVNGEIIHRQHTAIFYPESGNLQVHRFELPAEKFDDVSNLQESMLMETAIGLSEATQKDKAVFFVHMLMAGGETMPQ